MVDPFNQVMMMITCLPGHRNETWKEFVKKPICLHENENERWKMMVHAVTCDYPTWTVTDQCTNQSSWQKHEIN